MKIDRYQKCVLASEYAGKISKSMEMCVDTLTNEVTYGVLIEAYDYETYKVFDSFKEAKEFYEIGEAQHEN